MPIISLKYQREHPHFHLSGECLPRHFQGACRPIPPNKQGSPKQSGPAKRKLLFPPVGGWIGGHPDNNGMSKTDTYGGKGTMPRSECMNKGKPN